MCAKLWYMPQVAAALGLSEAAMRSMLHRGRGPQPLRLDGGRRLAWRPEDLDAWVQAQAIGQGVAYSASAAQPHQQEPPRRRRGRPRKQN